MPNGRWGGGKKSRRFRTCPKGKFSFFSCDSFLLFFSIQLLAGMVHCERSGIKRSINKDKCWSYVRLFYFFSRRERAKMGIAMFILCEKCRGGSAFFNLKSFNLFEKPTTRNIFSISCTTSFKYNRINQFNVINSIVTWLTRPVLLGHTPYFRNKLVVY